MLRQLLWPNWNDLDQKRSLAYAPLGIGIKKMNTRTKSEICYFRRHFWRDEHPKVGLLNHRLRCILFLSDRMLPTATSYFTAFIEKKIRITFYSLHSEASLAQTNTSQTQLTHSIRIRLPTKIKSILTSNCAPTSFYLHDIFCTRHEYDFQPSLKKIWIKFLLDDRLASCAARIKTRPNCRVFQLHCHWAERSHCPTFRSFHAPPI